MRFTECHQQTVVSASIKWNGRWGQLHVNDGVDAIYVYFTFIGNIKSRALLIFKFTKTRYTEVFGKEAKKKSSSASVAILQKWLD